MFLWIHDLNESAIRQLAEAEKTNLSKLLALSEAEEFVYIRFPFVYIRVGPESNKAHF